ncbi:hypothetical protein J7I93_05445 [Bacillus sp. ISL-47]|nr:hypothetical protein [Bacillus sp. ISL-47]MBT2711135.1 hypothetical protein [Pseudomonas sp. ISL-84]
MDRFERVFTHLQKDYGNNMKLLKKKDTLQYCGIKQNIFTGDIVPK